MNRIKIKGKINRPRLYIFKSNKHIYAQVIDDYNDKVITSSSTLSKELKKNNQKQAFANCENATIIGEQIAQKLQKLGINQVVFDRGQNIYHGKIKALANAARKKGIKF